MAKFFVVTLIMLQTSAWAAPFERYSAKLKVDRAASATLHLQNSEGMNCSAVFIGKNGEALTNLHCLEKCLERAGVVSQISHAGIVENTVNLSSPVKCSLEIMKFQENVQTVEVQILKVFGPGFLTPRESLPNFQSRSPELFASYLARGFEGHGDLALFRLPQGGLTACSKLSALGLNSARTTPIYNLSYPLVYRRDPNANPMDPDAEMLTLGRTLLVSHGEATADLTSLTGKLTTEYRETIQKWLGYGTFLTSLDAEGGSSGSPVYTSDGALIGLVRSSFKPAASDFTAWMTEAIDLSADLPQLRLMVPSNSECDGASSVALEANLPIGPLNPN